MLSTQYIRPAQSTAAPTEDPTSVGDRMIVATLPRPRTPRTRSRAAQAFYLSPLAKITTPGQLVAPKVYIPAIRSRSRRRRMGPIYFLSPPLYLSPIIVPGTPGQGIVVVRYLDVASRTRKEMPMRAGHSRLHAPKLVRVKVWPPS